MYFNSSSSESEGGYNDYGKVSGVTQATKLPDAHSEVDSGLNLEDEYNPPMFTSYPPGMSDESAEAGEEIEDMTGSGVNSDDSEEDHVAGNNAGTGNSHGEEREHDKDSIYASQIEIEDEPQNNSASGSKTGSSEDQTKYSQPVNLNDLFGRKQKRARADSDSSRTLTPEEAFGKKAAKRPKAGDTVATSLASASKNDTKAATKEAAKTLIVDSVETDQADASSTPRSLKLDLQRLMNMVEWPSLPSQSAFKTCGAAERQEILSDFISATHHYASMIQAGAMPVSKVFQFFTLVETDHGLTTEAIDQVDVAQERIEQKRMQIEQLLQEIEAENVEVNEMLEEFELPSRVQPEALVD